MFQHPGLPGNFILHLVKYVCISLDVNMHVSSSLLNRQGSAHEGQVLENIMIMIH